MWVRGLCQAKALLDPSVGTSSPSARQWARAQRLHIHSNHGASRLHQQHNMAPGTSFRASTYLQPAQDHGLVSNECSQVLRCPSQLDRPVHPGLIVLARHGGEAENAGRRLNSRNLMGAQDAQRNRTCAACTSQILRSNGLSRADENLLGQATIAKQPPPRLSAYDRICPRLALFVCFPYAQQPHNPSFELRWCGPDF